MHVVVTGAGGFIGAALAERLQSAPLVPGTPLRLTLVDRVGPVASCAPGVQWHVGSFADCALFDALEDHPPDCVFHLASVPGSLAEREPALGVQANLLDTVALCEGLARPVRAGRAPVPRLVFASSVAVYGALGAQAVDEGQWPQPTLSYGVHKWMVELLLADYARRGDIDGRSLRLPGIVARPPAETGHGSAFMSQIFHALRARQAYTCPVSARATAWWMSLECCLDNLVHAARLPTEGMPAERCWQPPVLRASVEEVVQAIARAVDADPAEWIGYAPDTPIETLFGRLPALHTPRAEAAGFQNDGSLQSLVTRVLGGVQGGGGVK